MIFRCSPSALCARRLYGAWKSAEDKLLLEAYEKHGPAWTIVSFAVPSRSPTECRKRHIRLSGILETDERLRDGRLAEAVYQEGFELAKDGSHLVRVPEPVIEESPLAKLSGALPKLRRRKEQDMRESEEGRPWTELEQFVMREAYEVYGPNWKVIAGRLERRSPEEVKAFMEQQAISLQS